VSVIIDAPRQLIVGAAIVRHAEVLAARRTAPPRLAGGWEFPGGKVDPGEGEHDALVRECVEELGVDVRVGPRLGGDLAVPPTGVLRVWFAELADETATPEPLEDHDELRWLGYEQLDDVPWLPVDVPLLDELRASLAEGEPLGGGLVAGPVRIGSTVRRPTGPWTPAVHELLHHLVAAGVPHVPRVHRVDDRGHRHRMWRIGPTCQQQGAARRLLGGEPQGPDQPLTTLRHPRPRPLPLVGPVWALRHRVRQVVRREESGVHHTRQGSRLNRLLHRGEALSGRQTSWLVQRRLQQPLRLPPRQW
jgi:8-oxo-dGTP diphosphatase